MSLLVFSAPAKNMRRIHARLFGGTLVQNIAQKRLPFRSLDANAAREHAAYIV